MNLETDPLYSKNDMLSVIININGFFKNYSMNIYIEYLYVRHFMVYVIKVMISAICSEGHKFI